MHGEAISGDYPLMGDRIRPREGLHITAQEVSTSRGLAPMMYLTVICCDTDGEDPFPVLSCQMNLI